MKLSYNRRQYKRQYLEKGHLHSAASVVWVTILELNVLVNSLLHLYYYFNSVVLYIARFQYNGGGAQILVRLGVLSSSLSDYVSSGCLAA